MTIRSHLSLIIAVIRLEQLHLFAFELEKLLYLTVYTLASTVINQSAPNLVKRYRAIRSCVSLIMGVIGPEHWSYLPLNLKNLFISLCLH